MEVKPLTSCLLTVVIYFLSFHRLLPPCAPPPTLLMPVTKKHRLKGGGPTLDNALILRRMSLNINFPLDGERDHGRPHRCSPASSLLEGDGPRDRNPFEDEEDENEANEVKTGAGSSGRGSLKFRSPLKSLGKLGKTLRMSGRSKDGATPSPQGSLQGTPPPPEKKKRGRRSSEGSLLRYRRTCELGRSSACTFAHLPRLCCCRFAGRYRDSHREAAGELHPEAEADSSSRRQSFMKMVGLGKLKRESMPERSSLGTQEQEVQPRVEELKPREPLSGKDQGFPPGPSAGSARGPGQTAPDQPGPVRSGLILLCEGFVF